MQSEIFGAHAVSDVQRLCTCRHSQFGRASVNLINEILDLSRIEAGRYEILNEEAVSLNRVVEDCHHLLKLRGSNRGITIHELFEPDMPRLWADECEFARSVSTFSPTRSNSRRKAARSG